MDEKLKRIEEELNEKVRPALQSHGGDIEIDHLEGKVLHVKMLGHCAGCPSADLTNEMLVEAELVKALPDIVEHVAAVSPISDEMWDDLKKFMKEHNILNH